MGRTSHNRAFSLMSYFSIPVPPNGGAAADSTFAVPVDVPMRDILDGFPAGWTHDQKSHSFLGLGWSVTTVTNTPTVNIEQATGKFTTFGIVTGGARADIALTSGVDDQSGLINGALGSGDATEANLLNEASGPPPSLRSGSDALGPGYFINPTGYAAAGELVDDVHVGIVCAPKAMAVEFNGIVDQTELATNYGGIATGGYSIIPLADVAAVASGSGANVVSRSITIPFNCRLQGLMIQSGSSGAANTLNIYNATTSTVIHSMTHATTTPDSLHIAPASFTGGMGPAVRNFSKGQVVQLRTDTAVSGFANLQVCLIVNATGHFHYDIRRDWFTRNAEDYPARNRDPHGRYHRTNLSGPVSGGWICIPLPRGTDTAAAGAYEPISSFTAPFDMEIEYVGVYGGTIVGTVPHRIWNETQSAAVYAAANLTTADWFLHDQGDAWTTPTTAKGDLLELQTQTGGGESVTDASGFIIARVTGHANTHPRWD